MAGVCLYVLVAIHCGYLMVPDLLRMDLYWGSYRPYILAQMRKVGGVYDRYFGRLRQHVVDVINSFLTVPVLLETDKY